jgi:hypothetical protein
MLLCALAYLFCPFEILWDIAAIAFPGIWFVQLLWVSRERGIKRRTASGHASPAWGSPAAAPPGLTRKERQTLRRREKLHRFFGISPCPIRLAISPASCRNSSSLMGKWA